MFDRNCIKKGLVYTMNKMLKTIICVLISIVLFAGCSGVGDKHTNTHTDTAMLSIPPTYFNSIDEFHDYLLSVRAYADGALSPLGMDAEEEHEMQIAVDEWGIGDIQHYFMPSWFPEGFVLNDMSITDRYVGYGYAIDNYDFNLNFDHEYVLNNSITFEWVKSVQYTTQEFIADVVERQGLSPVSGIEGLYYADYGTTEDPGVNLARQYFWIQDSYRFMLSLPLWTITETSGGISEAVANALVMDSALEIELEDNVYYEPPVSVELDQTSAEISVGNTLALTADVSPIDATIKNVIWSSSNNSVATVSQSGVVTKVGPGSATITARTLADNLTATFQLISDTYTVTYNSNGATGGSVPNDGSDYASGNSVTVKANTGNLVRTNYEFQGWSESPTATTPTYAVSGTTITPANFNMGTSNVTLYAVWGTSSGGVLPTGITLDCEYIAIRPYDNTTLTATVSPNNATNQTVTWYSSNDEWVTVDEYGYVESIEDIVYLTDEPYVTITAETVNGLTATCTVEIQHIRR